jgi:hypothetical protein
MVGLARRSQKAKSLPSAHAQSPPRTIFFQSDVPRVRLRVSRGVVNPLDAAVAVKVGSDAADAPVGVAIAQATATVASAAVAAANLATTHEVIIGIPSGRVLIASVLSAVWAARAG